MTLSVMSVSNETVRNAFNAFIEHYGKRKERAWDITDHVKMYADGEEAFSGIGNFESFNTIYNNLRGYWQALRPYPIGTWNAKKTFEVLHGLDKGCRLKRLSDLADSDWPKVWDCICRMRGLKPNKSGPSVVAVSKFLHFWNPRIFMIVDVEMMQYRVLGHRWLNEQRPEVADRSAYPGAEDERNEGLCDYLRTLMWGSELMKANPVIRKEFVATVNNRVTRVRVPPNIADFEGPAVEWFLLGLVELPPEGVRM